MSALAAIMGYVEYLIPVSFPVPGVRLGLANVMILPVLYLFGLPEAFTVSLVRVCLTGLLFGNLFGIFYSLTGTVFSLFTMTALMRTKRFSVIGVSAAGGAMHNLGQLTAAAVVTESTAIFRYLPVLLIAGDATGCIIGLTCLSLLKRIPSVSH